MAKELLKEAIADAKAVREVALQNAKMALEEAFDSKIKSMLSAKLAEEIEEDVELEEEYIEEEAETTDEAIEATDEGMSYEEDDKVDEAEDEDLDEEINLDELMAELESLEEGDDEEEVKEGKDEDDDEVKEGKDEEELDEVDLSGSVEALPDAVAALTFLAGAVGIPAMAYLTSGGVNLSKLKSLVSSKLGDKAAAAGEQAAKSAPQVDVAESTEFDIDALVAEIESEIEEGKKVKGEEDVKEVKKKDDEEKDKMKEELEEALSTVSNLQETISEMNLLNSKLLYCNKLFRANALTEAQKVKVVDALDKATTTGEAKLVFETLQESFNFTGVEKRAIQEGLGRASKAAGTAPKKVITESVDETVSRFQKLANIKF